MYQQVLNGEYPLIIWVNVDPCTKLEMDLSPVEPLHYYTEQLRKHDLEKAKFLEKFLIQYIPSQILPQTNSGCVPAQLKFREVTQDSNVFTKH